MINLGDLVRDPVTGLEGTVMCIHSYLHGCNRVSVQPKLKEDGTVPDAPTFDEPQLEIIKKKAVPRGDTTTGGPEKFMSNSKE